MQEITKFISCVALPGELDEAIEQGYNEIYVMSGDGIYKHHKLRGENRFIRLKVDKIPNYKGPVVTETINFLPDGPIPIELFDQIHDFFKQVMATKKAVLEAMAWVCWNKTEGYHIIIPDQRVSAASASYDWGSLPEGSNIVCDIHSHNHMSAFFSGTDNNDDKNNIGFSGVIGKMNEATPMTVWRFNYKDKKIDCAFDDIFAVPARPEQESNPAWLDKVQIHTPPVRITPTQQKWVHPQAPYGSGKGQGSSQGTIGRTYRVGENQNGNREGPHLRGGGKFPDSEFFGQLWGMGEEYDFLIPRGTEDERFSVAERTLSNVTEDPSYGETHLGESVSEEQSEHSNVIANVSSLEDVSDAYNLGYSMGDDRYDELIINHGKNVAETFCLIDDVIHVLNGKDDLNKDLMTDMFHMMSEEGQANFFKSLYHELPNKVQEEIQTQGF